MADKRKLQSDIDRNLKRVQEGRSAFQDTLDKFESSNNPAQKEKFEGDLKKEIKKLQRLRDQIKTWLTASEVKDKRSLLEARKEIEQDMERFKIIEKETKTKAYSKEGLLSTEAKKDPQQKEKEELDEWLKQCISSLNTQSEKYEFEIENLSNHTKKKRIDKEAASLIEEKRQRLETCSYHIEKLETIMRLLDNERLDCTNVRFIRESMEYVIDCGDDQSLFEFKNLYDDLNLDELGDSTGITPAVGVTSNLDNDLTIVNNVNTISSTHRTTADDGSVVSVPTNNDQPIPHQSSTTSSNASSRERTKSDEKLALSHTSSLANTPVKVHQTPIGKQKSSNIINQATTTTLVSQVVAGTPNKSSGKSQNHLGSNGSYLNNETTKSITVTNDALSDSVARNLKHSEHNNISQLSSLTTSITSGTVTSGNNSILTSHLHQYAASIPKCEELNGCATSLRNDMSNTYIKEELCDPSQSLRAPSPSTNDVLGKFSDIDNSITRTSVYANSLNYSPTNACNTPPSLLSSAMLAASQGKQFTSLLNASQHTSNSIRPNQSMNIDSSSIGGLSMPNKFQLSLSGSSVISQSQPYNMTLDGSLSSLQQSRALQSSPIHAHMHPRDAAAPFRNRNLDKPKNAVPLELLLQLQALDSGYRRLPHPCDTEKARMIVSKNPANCPSYYPRDSLTGTDAEEHYMKLDAQTLFFIFYYFEGTKAQYLAAKALKRMSWRFHTKFMMWFQRHEEPKQITDEYESGSYIYYDFRSMRQRKKEEFMFHYSFLEDKDF